VQSNILPELHARFERVIGKQTWTLAPSEEANEEMTLNFHYPPASNYKGLLTGRRSNRIRPWDQAAERKSFSCLFCCGEFPKEFTGKPAAVIVLDANAPFGKGDLCTPKITALIPLAETGMSRHWSDVR